jgi:hypothetical protein
MAKTKAAAKTVVKGKASKEKEPEEKGKKKAPTPPPPEKYEYDVNTLAEKLGVTAFTTRMKLRDAGIKKAGRSYGWDTKKEFLAVVEKLTKE